MYEPQRPLGVTLIALYSGLFGLLIVPVGCTATSASAMQSAGALYSIVGFLIFGLGVLFLAAAYGLWTVQSWARLYSWWLYLVCIPLGLLAIFPLLPGQQMSAGNTVLQLVGVAIAVAVLVCLSKPDMIKFFDSVQRPGSFDEFVRREPQ